MSYKIKCKNLFVKNNLNETIMLHIITKHWGFLSLKGAYTLFNQLLSKHKAMVKPGLRGEQIDFDLNIG